jgi:uncharacterized paraquat-inducible protein A
MRSSVGVFVLLLSASAASADSKSGGIELIVDRSFILDSGVRPATARAQCELAVRTFARSEATARRGLYELAWRIPKASEREDAAEIVHRLRWLDDAAKGRAERCCARADYRRPATLKFSLACIVAASRG